MTKNNIVSFCAGGLICLTACISLGSNDSEKVLEQRPVVSSMTVSPEIPNSVPFCGKMIDITRYNMREGFDRELSSFTYFHSTTMLLIKRANRYFPVIEPILKANGIPDDFKYLAVIESHLDPRVSSPARAVGMWQLLEGTAKQYGCTITPTVDERCHVEKATEAACRYLKAAYDKYGDWAAVASSYNAGMGRISGELVKQDADNTFDLWLVEETVRYVYRIMAIKQIFENPYKYGFVLRARDLYKPIECVEVAVSGDVQDLSAFAKEHGITYADLKRFNPWLRDRKLLTGGKTFKIQIPQEKDLYYKTPNSAVHNPDWVVK
ncbi:lytic transglycosylase domain-containing protein [Parabacteroides bouchesdurhonensis]|uniref:lytic transglycosylase domain-containing protein n=1 Tax=Parabacteroides bouchesdurhonensis TaxID=1936995 RepID=UPI0026AEDC2C